MTKLQLLLVVNFLKNKRLGFLVHYFSSNPIYLCVVIFVPHIIGEVTVEGRGDDPGVGVGIRVRQLGVLTVAFGRSRSSTLEAAAEEGASGLGGGRRRRVAFTQQFVRPVTPHEYPGGVDIYIFFH